MSAYVVPQVLVYQDFNATVQSAQRELNAHISGGHAQLIRYAEADEKASGYLGYYDETQDTPYDWPARPAGAVVDQTYTKVFLDNALLRYFDDPIGGGSAIQTVAGKVNRVRSATIAFKAHGTTYPRAAILLDRDAAIGDAVRVRAVVGDEVYTLWTYITGFVGEVVAASISAATDDAGNAVSQAAPSSTFEQTEGTVNNVEISSVSAANYDGLADGDINETYTIEVIEESAGGDFTTARLRVTSASGNDDVSSLTPSASGVATAVGTRGLTVTWGWANEESASESLADDSANFTVGQTWVVTCGQFFEAPVADSGGAYTGDTDATYIIEVSKGGTWADEPEITVTTTRGTDTTAPVVVACDDGECSVSESVAATAAVACGTKGVTIAFSGFGLRKGDIYYIAADAEREGAYQTLTLANNLDPAVVANGATDVSLTLYIRKNIEVSANRIGYAPLTNYEQSALQITLNSAMVAYDSTWTDDGVPQALPVYSSSTAGWGRIYVEARYWLASLCNAVGSVYDVGDLDDYISGSLHPDNPLKWGVYKALANSNGVSVRFTAVSDPADVDTWVDVLSLLDGRDDVYQLVPLTKLKTVMDLFEAHVNNQSTAVMGRWRVAWLNGSVAEETAIVDATVSTDDDEVLAVIGDNPDAAGTQYTLLTVPAGNGQFITNGVLPGDVVRALYESDGFDGESYTEFVVDDVVNEDTLLLATGHNQAVTTARKIEVWRTLSAAAKASHIALTEGYSNRRVRYIWPDEVGSGGLVFPGYHLCAALAGLASGIVPHQGMTRLAVAGFDDVSRTTMFNRDQLNTMAGGGVWIVTTNEDGDIFTRHAVTTADYEDIDAREEAVTRNVDSISYYMFSVFDPYIGISNITDSLLALLDAELKSAISYLKGSNYTTRLGGQLIDAAITELRQHLTLEDRIVVALSLTVPYALNNVECHLVV